MNNKKTDFNFSATKDFTHQFEIARLAKIPEAGLFLHRLRSFALLLKVKIKYKDGRNEIRRISYERVSIMESSDAIMLNTVERGILRYTNRNWDSVQSMASMGADQINPFGDDTKEHKDFSFYRKPMKEKIITKSYYDENKDKNNNSEEIEIENEIF